MIEQLREKYRWKDGFSDMANWEEACGQMGGGELGGSSEIMCEEIFLLIVTNLLSTHRRIQIYPVFGAQYFFWLRNWPSKLKSHFFRGSFSQPTSNSKWVGEPD